MKKNHVLVMCCNHVLDENETPSPGQYPDLLCQKCIDKMLEANFDDPKSMEEHFPSEIHLACRNCILE